MVADGGAPCQAHRRAEELEKKNKCKYDPEKEAYHLTRDVSVFWLYMHHHPLFWRTCPRNAPRRGLMRSLGIDNLIPSD